MPVVKTPKQLAGISSVQVPLFGGHVMLTLDRDQHKRVMDYLKIENGHRPPESIFDETLGFCADYQNSKGGITVVVHVGDWRLDTLVHELAHATFMICDYKGVETDKGKRETFAYLQDFLFAEFYPPTTKRWQEEEDKKEASQK